MPIHCRPSRWATATAVPQPQNVRIWGSWRVPNHVVCFPVVKVGQHIVVADRLAECLHDERYLAAALNDFSVGRRRRLIPPPRITKCLDLRCRTGAVLFGEKHVVVLIAVERRVKIDQIDRFIGDVTTENVEVIPVVERVHGGHDNSPFRLEQRRSYVPISSWNDQTWLVSPAAIAGVSPFSVDGRQAKL